MRIFRLTLWIMDCGPRLTKSFCTLNLDLINCLQRLSLFCSSFSLNFISKLELPFLSDFWRRKQAFLNRRFFSSRILSKRFWYLFAIRHLFNLTWFVNRSFFEERKIFNHSCGKESGRNKVLNAEYHTLGIEWIKRNIEKPALSFVSFLFSLNLRGNQFLLMPLVCWSHKHVKTFLFCFLKKCHVLFARASIQVD